MLSDAQGPKSHNGPTLPSFDFFLSALRQTLDEDELWGPDYYDYMEPKGQELNFGMQDLIKQCERLEKIMTPPTTPDCEPASPLPSFSYFSDRRRSLKTSSKTVYPKELVVPCMRVKRTKIAKVQAKMAREEEAWLRTMIQTAWLNLNPGKTELPSFSTLRRISIPGGP